MCWPDLRTIYIGSAFNSRGEEGAKDEVECYESFVAGRIIGAKIELDQSSHDTKNCSTTEPANN